VQMMPPCFVKPVKEEIKLFDAILEVFSATFLVHGVNLHKSDHLPHLVQKLRSG
jgi:hypothetical protein